MAHNMILELMLVSLFALICTTQHTTAHKMNYFRYYGDKVPQRLLNTNSRRVQHRIVMLHNYLRTNVRPSASNMLEMRWHAGAAARAQSWANQCRYLRHDPAENRAVPRFDQCGQNIFVSSHKVPWMYVTHEWYSEYQNHTYGSPRNDISVVGHYTQMVWASTHKVGCAITKCPSGGPRGKPFYNYVCNYCPAGNYPQLLATPYKAGPSCSSCRGSCKSSKIKLCTNSCNAQDKYSNCRQLFDMEPDWLCRKQKSKCMATCSCRKNKIYD